MFAPVEKVERKNKIFVALFLVPLPLGLCGFDRCFLGQVGLGFLKCLTGGGCLCWWLVDTCALIINIVMLRDSIDVLGMKGVFEKDGNGTLNRAELREALRYVGVQDD